jgi:hypothetical protein
MTTERSKSAIGQAPSKRIGEVSVSTLGRKGWKTGRLRVKKPTSPMLLG